MCEFVCLLSGGQCGEEKVELKQRKEGDGPSLPSQLSTLSCTEPGCDFVRQFKASLVNRTKQRHGVLVQAQDACHHCDALFKKQGPYNNMHQVLSGKLYLTTFDTAHYLETSTANVFNYNLCDMQKKKEKKKKKKKMKKKKKTKKIKR